jgi:hypothetical protein
MLCVVGECASAKHTRLSRHYVRVGIAESRLEQRHELSLERGARCRAAEIAVASSRLETRVASERENMPMISVLYQINCQASCDV